MSIWARNGKRAQGASASRGRQRRHPRRFEERDGVAFLAQHALNRRPRHAQQTSGCPATALGCFQRLMEHGLPQPILGVLDSDSPDERAHVQLEAIGCPTCAQAA